MRQADALRRFEISFTLKRRLKGLHFLDSSFRSNDGFPSPQPLHRNRMVPWHYPLVLDFHAEAGGVGWDDAAVFGHGHDGYGADFFEGDAGVGAHPELCHWGFGHCEGEVLAVGCACACVGDGGDAGCLGDGVYLDGFGESAAPLDVGLGDVYGAMLDELAEGVAVKGGAMKDHRGGEKLYHLAVVVQHKCPC